MQAQTTHFSEDFNSGVQQGYQANGYNGWTVTTPGANGLYANEWFVTCAENGNPTGTCGAGCPIIGIPDETLHIGNVQGSPLSIFCPLGDCGAAYDAGLFTGEVVTDKRAESPIIDLTCATNPVTISFRYIENGEGVIDNFTLDFFDGITWSQLDDPAKTINNCSGQGRWTLYSFNLPVSAAGNPNVQIGLRWVNDDNANGTDPSVAVDSLRVTSQATTPNADFSTSPNANLCEGDCVNFSDISTGNIVNWNWTFSGGVPTTSNLQTPPSICWNTAGGYIVTLTITDNCGNIDVQTHQITVSNCSGPINANFTTANTNICVGTCIGFTDLSTPAPIITSWIWTFPGGTPGSFNGQNPTNICYNSVGTYSVILSVSDGIQNDITLIGSYINVTACSGPIAGFNANPSSGCVNDCFTFNNQSQNSTTWQWSFPGGTPNSFIGQNPPSICYSAPGNYNVSQYVTDAAGNTDTLTQIGYIIVTNCIFPIAGFSSNITAGCVNDCFAFNDQSQNATTWGWGFPGGTPNFYIGQSPPAVCYSLAGTYDVAQYVSDANGNTDTLIQVGYITITNCPPPVAGFTTPITTGCVSDCFNFSDQSQNATTWGWGFPGGTPAFFVGQNPPQICYSVAGVYDVAQYVTSGNGQTDTLIQVGYITITNCVPPTALFTVDATSGCENNCMTFTDQSIGVSSWSWNFAGGNPSTFSGQSPPSICYALPGNYDVQLIVANAFGVDTLTQQSFITINICSLSAQFSASDSLICEGDCITLFNQSIGQGFPNGCKWIIPGAQPDTTSAINPYVCFPNAGNYSVTLIAFDSTGADTVIYNGFIQVSSGTPVITNIESATIYAGQSIQLDASGGNSYMWYQNIPINSLDNDSVSNPIASPIDTTIYQVIMIDAEGCSSAKTIIINVIPPEFVWAPTAFTPNNDKINDVFYLKVNGIIVKYTMKIFTRWGEMVFSANDPTQGWDGTYRSVNLNVGVYIYYYRIEFIDGVILEKSGDITLLK